ncbi:Helicase associated domain protein [Kitasatospora sp. NPDC001159]
MLAERLDRLEALAEIDPDWNPAWPLDWQRHYAAVGECLDGGAQPADLVPGVTIHGHDVGRWLERQRQHIVWQGLMDGQRGRLAALGIQPLAAPAGAVESTAAKGAAGGRKAGAGKASAFDRGLTALTQYKARTGTVTVARGHIEVLEDGANDGRGEEAAHVKLGIWLSNTTSRRAKLTEAQLDRLAELGLGVRGRRLAGREGSRSRCARRFDGHTVRYGMALGDARTVVLPLGPRHLIALGREHREVHITRQHVDQINEIQIRAAEQHVFCRPGSPLERFILDTIRRRDQ